MAPRGYRGGDIRRIGVAYDGSPEADAALRAAEAVALELAAALTVYCVLRPSAPIASMFAAGTALSGRRTPPRSMVAVSSTRVADNAPHGLNPETLLLHGEPAAEIAARADGVLDLLFVGSRGYGPLRRALLGSVSAALVRDAGCPVIVTPRTAIAPGQPANVAGSAHA